MELLGTSERFAQYVLTGKRRPGGEKALRLARRLGVPLEAVLFPEQHGFDLEARLCALLEQRERKNAEGEAGNSGRDARRERDRKVGSEAGENTQAARAGRSAARVGRTHGRGAGRDAGLIPGWKAGRDPELVPGWNAGRDAAPYADRETGRRTKRSALDMELEAGRRMERLVPDTELEACWNAERVALDSESPSWSAGRTTPRYDAPEEETCAAWHSPYPGEAWSCEDPAWLESRTLRHYAEKEEELARS